MSKYTIKLEQLVSTANFGDVVLTIQYDFNGAKIISVAGDKISSDLHSQISSSLNMLNFCLTKGITMAEIVDQMISPNPTTQMDHLIAVILDNIKTAPTKIQDILQGDVIEINPNILKHLR